MSQTTPKRNDAKSGDAQARRLQRQIEAEARKQAAAQRTPDEQLARLRERGISSGREFERLTAMVEGGRGKLQGHQHDKIVAEDSSTFPKAGKKKGAKR
jgi:predicted DNA binding protein